MDTLETSKVSKIFLIPRNYGVVYLYGAESSVLYIERCPLFGCNYVLCISMRRNKVSFIERGLYFVGHLSGVPIYYLVCS